MQRDYRGLRAQAILALLCMLGAPHSRAQSAPAPKAVGLWAHDNLVAWEVIPYDALKRGPEERAAMLSRVGFKHYAYLAFPDQEDKDMTVYGRAVDAEVEALQRQGIDLLAWFLIVDTADDPKVRTALDSFKRHGVHPQLWVAHSWAPYPRSPEQWARYYPKGFVVPRGIDEFEKRSDADKRLVRSAWVQISTELSPKTPEEQIQRVQREAERIKEFVKIAAAYGCKVNIYNEGGWFGMVENQVAIVRRLKEMGVDDVGMVYNFSHSRDELHDDSKNFPQLWALMRPYVVDVNVIAVKMDYGYVHYPSQGEAELEMMRTIQESGWKGPVGLPVQQPGDAEVTLRNDVRGLDWLAAELKQAGSGGPRPFPLIPDVHYIR
jgi:hypothetical protein